MNQSLELELTIVAANVDRLKQLLQFLLCKYTIHSWCCGLVHHSDSA